MEINRNMDSLYPPFGKLVSNGINRCREKGLLVSAFETLRSLDRQEEQFTLGNSKAAPGLSFHNWGLAVDIAFQPIVGRWTWQGDWASVGKIMLDIGLEWGRDFKRFPELCHFQKTYGYTIEQIKSVGDVHGIDGVWAFLDEHTHGSLPD